MQGLRQQSLLCAAQENKKPASHMGRINRDNGKQLFPSLSAKRFMLWEFKLSEREFYFWLKYEDLNYTKP